MALRYILVPNGVSTLDNVNEVARKTGRPAPISSMNITKAAGKCGNKDDGLGGSQDDPNFGGQAEGAYLQIVNKAEFRSDRAQDVYAVGTAIPNGASATAFTNLLSGEICAETINSTTYYFKKYSCDVV
jgi:hypothetical protein